MGDGPSVNEREDAKEVGLRKKDTQSNLHDRWDRLALPGDLREQLINSVRRRGEKEPLCFRQIGTQARAPSGSLRWQDTGHEPFRPEGLRWGSDLVLNQNDRLSMSASMRNDISADEPHGFDRPLDLKRFIYFLVRLGTCEGVWSFQHDETTECVCHASPRGKSHILFAPMWGTCQAMRRLVP